MTNEPKSLLTRTRPDIWTAGLALATSLTGIEYAHKPAQPDGGIRAYNEGHREGLVCYGYYTPNYTPPAPLKTPEEIAEEEALRKKREMDREIEDCEREIANIQRDIKQMEVELPKAKERLAERQRRLKKLREGGLQVNTIFVPEGSMEWLLHEVGHWLVATLEERVQQDYGLGDTSNDSWGRGPDCEWRAWAFEEIVLCPFGNARAFAPPTQRDGVAFAKSGPIAAEHLAYVDREMSALGIDREQWRRVWGDWVAWGKPLRAWDRLS